MFLFVLFVKYKHIYRYICFFCFFYFYHLVSSSQDGWHSHTFPSRAPLDYYRSGLEPVTTGYHIEFCIGVYISPFVIVILNYLGWRYLYLGLLDYSFPWKPRKEAKKQHFGNSGVWTQNLYDLLALKNFALAFGNLSAKQLSYRGSPIYIDEMFYI